MPRDRPFDPWREPRTEKARAIVCDVLNQLGHYERHFGLRQRKRRAKDQAAFEALVTALACDAMHRALVKPDGRLAVSLSKRVLGRRERYGSPLLGETLPTVVERMAAPAMGWLTLEKGRPGWFDDVPARLTTIAAGPRLRGRMRDHGITLGDLKRRPGEEVLVLKRTKCGHWDNGDRIDYADSPDTMAHRSEVEGINRWLDEAHLEFVDSVASGRLVDTGDRRLRRYFNNGTFAHGGRLFGGFWQGLGKRQRLDGVLFGDGATGELYRAVELDFAQATPRILYGMAGAVPPPGDLYTVPGLEGHRRGVKRLFNALLFGGGRRAFPKETRPLFPSGMSVEDAATAVVAHHGAIKDLIEQPDIGFRAMLIESRILLEVLQQLREYGTVGLPIHDAVIVPSIDGAAAREIMEGSFREHSGAPGVVTLAQR